MNRDVMIIGCGASTSLGRSAPASATALRAGISRFCEHPYLLNQVGEPMVVARASFVGPKRSDDRICILAQAAATEALAAVDIRWRTARLPVVVGLPPIRPGRGQDLPKRVARAITSATGEAGPVQTIECGHAAGLLALEHAVESIRSGREKLYLVGGADSYLDVDTLEWLEDMGKLHGAGRRNNAWGFVPGEAASFLLLAAVDGRTASSSVRAECAVLAVASAAETCLIDTDAVCTGAGLTAAMRRVLDHLPAGIRVDEILCDLNGEPYRSDEFGFTLARTSDRFADADRYTAPADCYGDTGAASGPLFIATKLVTAGLRVAGKESHCLVWTSSDSGERGCALLRTTMGGRA